MIKTMWEIIKDQLNDTFVQILIGAAAVSLVTGILAEGIKYGWIDAVSISIAVCIITVVNTINE